MGNAKSDFEKFGRGFVDGFKNFGREIKGGFNRLGNIIKPVGLKVLHGAEDFGKTAFGFLMPHKTQPSGAVMQPMTKPSNDTSNLNTFQTNPKIPVLTTNTPADTMGNQHWYENKYLWGATAVFAGFYFLM